MAQAPRLRPDTAEALARVHLHHRGFRDVVWHPIHNSPPDFLVDGKLAIEVRRLTQHFVDDAGRARPLEETTIPLVYGLSELAVKLGPKSFDRPWAVTAEFSRPLPKWGKLKRHVLGALKAFATAPPSDAIEHWIDVTKHLRLRLSPPESQAIFDARPDALRRKRQSTFFLPSSGAIDLDAGGPVLEKLNRNIEICRAEKEVKITPVKDRYPEWWLLLVDYISRGVPLIVRDQQFQEIPVNPAPWNKIVLVSPANPELRVETV